MDKSRLQDLAGIVTEASDAQTVRDALHTAIADFKLIIDLLDAKLIVPQAKEGKTDHMISDIRRTIEQLEDALKVAPKQ